MAADAFGIEVPADSDAFDPSGDMRDMGASLHVRTVVPVVNATARDALVVVAGQLVNRLDTGTLERWDGASWVPVVNATIARILSRPYSLTVASGINTAVGAGWTPIGGDTGQGSGIDYGDGIATVQRAGLYWVMARYVVPVLSSGTWTIGLIVNNADPLADANDYDQEARGSNLAYLAHRPFNVGDTIQVFLRQISGSTQSVPSTNPSRWEMRRVGDA